MKNMQRTQCYTIQGLHCRTLPGNMRRTQCNTARRTMYVCVETVASRLSSTEAATSHCRVYLDQRVLYFTTRHPSFTTHLSLVSRGVNNLTDSIDFFTFANHYSI